MMTIAGNVVLLAAAGILAVPVFVFVAECTLGAGWQRRASNPRRPAGARAVVLIPAHDEELGIGATLERLKPELMADDSILVVADNCTDATAQVARQHGAFVLERHHATERGKGYALSFATAHLASLEMPPDVVIVLDADCVFSPGSVDALVAECLERRTPVQSDDELVLPQSVEVDIKTKISTFAFRVKNTLRTRGLDRLGLPRQLAGTGMAFPWHVFRDAPNMRGWITEDLVLGLELALRGVPTYLCGDARVESEVAPSAQGHSAQRQRWEHGHLAAIRHYVPKMLVAAVRQRRADLLVMTLDLAVPPLALLTNLVVGGLAVSLATVPLGVGWIPAIAFSAEMATMLGGVAIAWFRVGRDLLTLSDMLRIPHYMLSKSPSYLRWFRGRGAGGWVRAERRSAR